MALAAATVLVLEAAAAWLALQWMLVVVGERVPRARTVVAGMRVVDAFALVAGTTLCALLVLLPSFVFVVLEVFRFVQVRTHAKPAKSVKDYMERVVEIVNELEAMGERMREAAIRLNEGGMETVTVTKEERYEPVSAPEPATTTILPQICGKVLLAVCRHSEALERLYAALQPPAVDELVYCDCDDMEIRAEKVIALIGTLRECMERQTDVAKAANDLFPLLPTASPTDGDMTVIKPIDNPIDSPMMSTTPGCIEDEIEDSGFMDDQEILDAF
ncbi:hypothetical protein BU23DRAFT_231300 [Bimuria novae-zelandiae CBS 107.79]|uniref:Uncharacterized protein n=1 Tax=Bimuria novae-zelandiae CBS 107.79 TaxID=1447943 RepID=A0A6A5UZ10_9PLEO|nr:hypothetical protein BU23DRAFT_231300 [Bimuria novae-zelandiae CBS 107.79]